MAKKKKGDDDEVSPAPKYPPPKSTAVPYEVNVASDGLPVVTRAPDAESYSVYCPACAGPFANLKVTAKRGNYAVVCPVCKSTLFYNSFQSQALFRAWQQLLRNPVSRNKLKLAVSALLEDGASMPSLTDQPSTHTGS